MMAWGLYFAAVAHAGQACAEEIRLGRKLTLEEDGAIWAEILAQAKVALSNVETATARKPRRIGLVERVLMFMTGR